MKNYLFYILIVFVYCSCDNMNTISDDLVGDWEFSNKGVFSGQFGSTTFNSNNTGRGSSFVTGNPIVDFEWELLNGETMLKIIETNWANPDEGTTTYDITRIDEDNFVLNSINATLNMTRK